MRYLLIVAFAVVTLSVASAPPAALQQKPMSKADLDQMEQLEKALGALKDLEVSFEAAMKTRRFACLKAFGNQQFCGCLGDNLAVGLSFDGYIFVITKSKDELKYDQMSKDDKSLVDSAIKTRELCVK